MKSSKKTKSDEIIDEWEEESTKKKRKVRQLDEDFDPWGNWEADDTSDYTDKYNRSH
ncbi:MAG: hypothetical protein HQM07_08935 [Zetaproteobacteria bacterium]|nr:hypothetical protein [Zetaproteobacteria bacterium]